MKNVARNIKCRKTIRDLKEAAKKLELAFCNLKDIVGKTNKNLRNFGEVAEKIKINIQKRDGKREI